MMKKLPQSEIDDITKVCYEKIWQFKGTEKQNWENRIFGTYDKLSKKNPTFTKYVGSHDFWSYINGWYHDDLSESEFKNKVEEYLCKLRNLDFYFTIPHMYNFPTCLSLGTCKCYAWQKLPASIKQEFLDWWEIAYPWKKEESEEIEHRLNTHKQFLYLKFSVPFIGFDRSFELSTQNIDLSLNILRFVFDKSVDYTGIVAWYKEGKFSDGIWGDWENMRTDTQGRSYDNFEQDQIDQLSSLFKKKKLSDLQDRVKEAIVLYGISHSLSQNPLKLTVLCSGLESLVVKEKDVKGERIAERIPDLITNVSKSDVKGNLRKFYKKRSRFVHAKQKEPITKDDINTCRNYLKLSIEKIMDLIVLNYDSLSNVKGKKSLVQKFNWS